MQDQAEWAEALRILDRIDSEFAHRGALLREAKTRVGTKNFGKLLFEEYLKSRSWRIRAVCVYHCIGRPRTDDHSYRIGLEGIKDKSRVVRYRACMLLAVAQRDEALPHLRKLLLHSDEASVADARAAIDAIENRNKNFFVDRDHSGMIELDVISKE